MLAVAVAAVRGMLRRSRKMVVAVAAERGGGQGSCGGGQGSCGGGGLWDRRAGAYGVRDGGGGGGC